MRFAGTSQALQDLLGAILTEDRLPAQTLWDTQIRDNQSFVLDPVALATAYGGPKYRRMAQAAAAYENAMASRDVDAGAARLDILLRTLGVNSNLAGASMPPTVHYPIAEAAHYTRKYKAPGKPSFRYKGEPGAIVEYINLLRTPMADWDVPGPSHASSNVTVRHLGDVEDIVRPYVKRHPASILKLYLTPGGFRAWELGERMSVPDFAPRFTELNVDPGYALLANTSGDGMPEWRAPGTSDAGIPLDPPGFRSRISHKPGRVDWVAQPLVTISGPESNIDLHSRFWVDRLHDEPIRRNYLSAGNVPGVSPAAMEFLTRQLPTVSASLRKRLTDRFSL
jgi:hypothetical protein